ncbi:MAG: dihydropteroate synthase [Gammaproteobacteria bacterium]|nr:dihydropteroate synthase [Gammaproteobacteria bacterium]
MGILNTTPDSFSDGGSFFSADASSSVLCKKALARVEQMVNEGASIIDIGGESTRPGATAVSIDEELDRVIPPIEAIHREFSVPISIDTSKPEVMTAAVAAGAGMINDVYGLRQPGALHAAADAKVPVCLMHMRGEPRKMQQAPHYADVVAEVTEFLSERINACLAAGIERARIVADPGFGFGKTLRHNLQLLRQLRTLHRLQVPILVGLSRKSMLGAIINEPVERRLYGSIACAVLAVNQGASIIRVHDVKATADALAVCAAVFSTPNDHNEERQ